MFNKIGNNISRISYSILFIKLDRQRREELSSGLRGRRI